MILLIMAGAVRNLKDAFGQSESETEEMDVDEEVSSVRIGVDYSDMRQEGSRLISLINEPGISDGRKRQLAHNGFCKYDDHRLVCFSCEYTIAKSVSDDIEKLHRGSKECKFLNGGLFSCDNVPLSPAPVKQHPYLTPETTPDHKCVSGMAVQQVMPFPYWVNQVSPVQTSNTILTPQTSPGPIFMRPPSLPGGHTDYYSLQY